MSQGIMYWASGERYVVEAERAEARVNEVWPEINTFIDLTDKGNLPPMLARMRSMVNSPYDETLFMDADTWMVEPVPELFEMMSRFEMALTLAAWRQVYPVNAPACFTELNPGVCIYRKTRAVEDLFFDWDLRFRRHYRKLEGVSHPEVGFFHSQPSFREALFHSDVTFSILPDEYCWKGSGYVQGKVKIVHKRPNPDQEAEVINAAAGRPRCKTMSSEVFVWA